MTSVSAASRNRHRYHHDAAPVFAKTSMMRSPFRPVLKLLALFLFVEIFCHGDIVEETATSEETQQQQQNMPIQLDPKRLLVNDVEVFVQLPPPPSTCSSESGSSSTSEIEGVVLLFHGCDHDGIDWFELPQEQQIVRYLLEQKFATVAISSLDRQGRRCWDATFPASQNIDAILVQSVLPGILQEHVYVHDGIDDESTAALPMYAIGVSSGGDFSSILCQVFPFVGLSVVVSPGTPKAWAWLIANSSDNNNNNVQTTTTMTPPPAIAFVYMPKDTRYAGAKQVMRSQKQLEGRHPTKAFPCEPKPLSATWIHEDIPSISLERAESILDILSQPPLSIIDTQTSMLKQDPRKAWKAIVNTSLVGLSDLEVASLKELFNIGFGSHATTSEYIPEVVRFWKEHNSETY